MIKLLIGIVGGYYVALPLLWALSLSETIDAHLARVLVLVIGAAAIFVFLFKKRIIIPRSSILFLFVGLHVWMILSLVYSPVSDWTLRKIAYFWLFVPLLFVLVQLFFSRQNALYTVTKAIVWGGALAALVGVVQFGAQFIFGHQSVADLWSILTPFFLGGVFSESVAAYNSWFVHVLGVDLFRAIGFFPDPHMFAFYTGMIFPLALGVYKHTKKKCYLVIAVLILGANLATFSRGAEIAMLCGFTVLVFTLWRSLSLRKRHGLMFMLSFLICVAILPQNSLTYRLLSSFDGADNSNSARIEIWQETLQIWAQTPIFGVGLGSYAHIVDPEADYRTPIYAHNMLLDVGVELGIVGFLLFLALLIRLMMLFYCARHPHGQFAFVAMVIFMVHSLFDTALFSVHVYPILLFLIAFGIYLEGRKSLKEC